MKLMSNLFVMAALAAACTAASAQSAGSVPLSVIGTVKPAGCDLTLANNGQVDLGSRTTSQISTGSSGTQINRSTAFSIVCGADAKVIYSFTDNKPGTNFWSSYTMYFGLGSQIASDGTTKNIGSVLVKIGSPQLAPLGGTLAAGRVLSSADGGVTWTADNTAYPLPNKRLTISTATTGPEAAATFAGSLDMNAWIAPAGQLDLTQKIDIDGSISMNLSYI